MMSLFRNKKSKPKVDHALNKVYLTLHQIQRRHGFVEISVEGDEVVYQSIILELDPEERTILIDELFPLGFQGLPGQVLNIRIRQQAGRALQFKTVVLEGHVHNDTPIYVLAMPQELESDQRRGAYRLPITELWPVESTFISPDSQLVNARVKNLSASGLCMQIKGDVADEFRHNDKLTHVAFEFAGIHFDCGLRVKNVIAEETPADFTLIGSEFIDLPIVEERLLERSIMRYQRDRVKMAEGDMAFA